ncbi:hypothetical protein [Pseudomonas phage Eir4]|nr:hypothetical protein [Pseudomonas phage Eir4]
MAFRKFSEIINAESGRVAKVGTDGCWGEYIVKFYVKGVYQKDADYHTSDRVDALDTANHWIHQKG